MEQGGVRPQLAGEIRPPQAAQVENQELQQAMQLSQQAGPPFAPHPTPCAADDDDPDLQRALLESSASFDEENDRELQLALALSLSS